MVAPARDRFAAHDPTVYPVSDDVGEDLLLRLIAEMLRPLLAAFLASRGVKALVGADQFIYWEQFEPTRTIAPDVYVLPGVAPEERVRSWKVWETGVVPSFALEIVSGDLQKDTEAARRYEELGVGELVVFDPDFAQRRDSVRFRVHRRLARRGLVLIEATNADRVRSKALGCFLRSVGEGAATRLRVGLGPRGDELLPTETERANTERALREEAEAELAKLRAELAKLRERAPKAAATTKRAKR
jgi:hypothetical protein